VEQRQEVQLRSNFGIGIEREIYSQPYFSYHYGYRDLSQIPIRSSKSKLYQIENLIKQKFANINFQILFLNVSKRGVFVNFVLKDRDNFNSLGIIPVLETNSFTALLDTIGGSNIPHREIFPKANLDEFNIEIATFNMTKEIISKFNPIFYCLGFDGYDRRLNPNTIHVELYPQNTIQGSKEFINILKTYSINTSPFEKYFLNFKRFSHIKFKIENGEIKNIKYYRSINVNIPEFYYG